MELPEESWFIVKQASNTCQILSQKGLETLAQSEALETSLKTPLDQSLKTSTESPAPASEANLEKWGPFTTQNQAIAKRVGLIRAGKCQPN